MRWILLTYKLPSVKSRARVAVWREIRRSGALHLQQSVVAFPDTEHFRAALEQFRGLVIEVGGQTLAVSGKPVGNLDGTQLVESWNASRDAEYAELIAVCQRFLLEIAHEFEIEKFTHAELEEEESEFEKLARWHERITARDVVEASNGVPARAAIDAARTELERYSVAVFERSQQAS